MAISTCYRFRVTLLLQYNFHIPVAVLVGPCVFIGSFYPETSRIQIRVEFGISGPELTQVRS